MKYECALCGALYPIEHVRDWGKHADSVGHGAKAVCTALVTDSLGSGASCRGDLVASKATSAELAALRPTRPIAL